MRWHALLLQLLAALLQQAASIMSMAVLSWSDETLSLKHHVLLNTPATVSCLAWTIHPFQDVLDLMNEHSELQTFQLMHKAANSKYCQMVLLPSIPLARARQQYVPCI